MRVRYCRISGCIVSNVATIYSRWSRGIIRDRRWRRATGTNGTGGRRRDVLHFNDMTVLLLQHRIRCRRMESVYNPSKTAMNTTMRGRK